jgi:hypothetical protein
MSEESDNLVLRLLRDIRGELAGIRETQAMHSDEFVTVKRQLVELKEDAAMAMGFGVSANTHYGTAAERPDRLTDTVADLKARLEKLEEKA